MKDMPLMTKVIWGLIVWVQLAWISLASIQFWIYLGAGHIYWPMPIYLINLWALVIWLRLPEGIVASK